MLSWAWAWASTWASKLSAAALAAAAWMSLGEVVSGRGRCEANSGKLRNAEVPLIVRAATSWARAAISGVEKEPSQILDFFLGSLISDYPFPPLTHAHTAIRWVLPITASLLLLIVTLNTHFFVFTFFLLFCQVMDLVIFLFHYVFGV